MNANKNGHQKPNPQEEDDQEANLEISYEKLSETPKTKKGNPEETIVEDPEINTEVLDFTLTRCSFLSCYRACWPIITQ